jgi:hypothetical protein
LFNNYADYTNAYGNYQRQNTYPFANVAVAFPGSFLEVQLEPSGRFY